MVSGCWRGVIINDIDPDGRGRCQVRIPQLHLDAAQDAHMPWAEVATFGGKLFGDLPNYRPGDLVWVVFEGGQERFPVIIGGWLSSSNGVGDYPADLSSDYASARYRWRRQDRAGNIVEMDARPGSSRVYVRSGGVELELNGATGSLTVNSTGPVNVHAPVSNVQARTASIDASTVTLQARAEAAGDPPTLNLFSADVVNLYAAGTINVGQYTDPAGSVRQAASLGLNPATIVMGGGDVPTVSISLQSSGSITAQAGSSLSIVAEEEVSLVSPSVSMVVSGAVVMTTPSFVVNGAVIDFSGSVSLIPPP